MRSDVAISVFMPEGFALERVVLHPTGTASDAQFTARVLPAVPSAVPKPDMLGPPGLVFDLSVVSGGDPLPVNAAILHFTVESSWLESSCPPETCMVGLLHWTGTEWELLRAERHETRGDGRVAFAAVARSLSPFVVAPLPPSFTGFPPVADEGAGKPLAGYAPLPTTELVWPLMLLTVGMFVAVVIFLVRQNRKRVVAAPEPLPLPPPRVDPPTSPTASPEGTGPPAPEPLLDLADSGAPTEPSPSAPQQPPAGS